MSATMPGVEVILGCGTVGDKSDALVKECHTPAATQKFLSLFRKYGHTHLDTARAYSPGAPGTSEPLLGQTDFRDWAIIDTKILHIPNLKRERIPVEIETSLEALKVDQMNIEYLHAMDRETPFEETCQAMNDAHRAGKFKEFGLSNAEPAEVEQFVEICNRNGWVKPTVYQGQYNPIARLPEEDLLPVLRKHGIRFYAWSPAAGGMFSGIRTQGGKQGTRGDTDSRIGHLHASQYHKEALINASNRVTDAAEAAGITGHAVALRWCLHHSALSGKHGDGIVIGASTLSQLDANLKACGAGPLPEHIVKLVDEVWKAARPHAPPVYFGKLVEEAINSA